MQVRWGNKGTTEEGAKLKRAEVFDHIRFRSLHYLATHYYRVFCVYYMYTVIAPHYSCMNTF